MLIILVLLNYFSLLSNDEQALWPNFEYHKDFVGFAATTDIYTLWHSRIRSSPRTSVLKNNLLRQLMFKTRSKYLWP